MSARDAMTETERWRYGHHTERLLAVLGDAEDLTRQGDMDRARRALALARVCFGKMRRLLNRAEEASFTKAERRRLEINIASAIAALGEASAGIDNGDKGGVKARIVRADNRVQEALGLADAACRCHPEAGGVEKKQAMKTRERAIRET